MYVGRNAFFCFLGRPRSAGAFPTLIYYILIMSTAKDLTTEAPRSPRKHVGGYAILGRTLDKGRALIGGNIGEYHFDCPLDNMLFGFKEVKGDEVKKLLEA